MKIEPIEIKQENYESIWVDISIDNVVDIWQSGNLIAIERQNIQKLIDILTAEL